MIEYVETIKAVVPPDGDQHTRTYTLSAGPKLRIVYLDAGWVRCIGQRGYIDIPSGNLAFVRGVEDEPRAAKGSKTAR